MSEAIDRLKAELATWEGKNEMCKSDKDVPYYIAVQYEDVREVVEELISIKGRADE